MNKKCLKCKITKPISSFVSSSKSQDGKRNYCKDCMKEYSRVWRANNQDKSRNAVSNYYKNNKDKVKNKIKKWNQDNTEKINKYRKSAEEKRMKNPTQKLNKTVSCAVRSSLKSKGANKEGKCWALLLDFSIGELKKHLEKQFQEGMTWENYGEWHIDHIIPITAFNFTTPYDIDFKRCWCLKNLRPLWAKDNIIKRNKLLKPFQPSLAMEA